ncbi:MAG: hypothetical protein ABIJ56_04900 [Pseudomonadota bacterium]
MLADSSDLFVNLLILLLVVISYLLPALLRARAKRRRGQVQQQAAKPRPARPAAPAGKEASAEKMEQAIKSIEALLSGKALESRVMPPDDDGAPAGPESRKTEALSISRDAAIALKQAHEIHEKILSFRSLMPLRDIISREIIAPLEALRKRALSALNDPMSPSSDIFYAISGSSALMEAAFLLRTIEEIMRPYGDAGFRASIAPSEKIATAFYNQIVTIVQASYSNISQLIPVAFPSQLYGAPLQDSKIARAGILLYPAYTHPAPSPHIYATIPFFMCANLIYAQLTPESLEEAELWNEPAQNIATLGADFLGCSILGPAYLAAMIGMEGNRLTADRIEMTRRALAAHQLEKGFSALVPDELSKGLLVSDARLDAVLGMPMFGNSTLAAVGGRSNLRFDYDDMLRVRESIASPGGELAKEKPLYLLAGAALAASGSRKDERLLAANLDSLLRGRMPKEAQWAAAGVRGPAGPDAEDLTSADVLDAIITGAVLGRRKFGGRNVL